MLYVIGSHIYCWFLNVKKKPDHSPVYGCVCLSVSVCKTILADNIYIYICIYIFLILKNILFRFFFREWGQEGERQRNFSMWLSLMCPLLGAWPGCSPSMCPDWESNLTHFGLQAGAQSTEPLQPGHIFLIFWKLWFNLISAISFTIIYT